VYNHFIPEEPSNPIHPVKIAILDTGLDPEHACIEAHDERIRGHNWISKTRSTDFRDSHGHGTHIAGLMLDFIPHAELYIAKVTDGKELDPVTLARVS